MVTTSVDMTTTTADLTTTTADMTGDGSSTTAGAANGRGGAYGGGQARKRPALLALRGAGSFERRQTASCNLPVIGRHIDLHQPPVIGLGFRHLPLQIQHQADTGFRRTIIGASLHITRARSNFSI